MSNTEKDGEVAAPETTEAVPAAPQADTPAQPTEPFVGFDADGYFVVRIHPSLGYHAVQGHLLEAQTWLRGITLHQQRKDMEASALRAEARKLVKPGGRFNVQ